jgi:hypothetical protein
VTHRLYLAADNIFLKAAKDSLEKLTPSNRISSNNILHGSIIIITCTCAIEAFVNNVFNMKKLLIHYDELKLLSKIETIHNLHSSNISWGENPYQTAKELISLRNWIIHFKESRFKGLVNTDLQWVSDNVNKPPQRNPIKIFSVESCTSYYNETRHLIVATAKIAGLHELYYDFAENEKYSSGIMLE